MEIVKIPLTIERQGGKELWGRVTYNDNLITDFANNVAELESKIKNLLWEFEEIPQENVEFIHQYDIYAVFQKFNFLKISTVAEHAGMNPGLLRQYVSGAKSPSKDQAKKIEKTLHNLAAELQEAVIITS